MQLPAAHSRKEKKTQPQKPGSSTRKRARAGRPKKAASMASAQGLQKRGLIHQAAARGIHQNRPRLHARNRLLVDQGPVAGERDMQGNHVAAGRQLVQGHDLVGMGRRDRTAGRRPAPVSRSRRPGGRPRRRWVQTRRSPECAPRGPGRRRGSVQRFACCSSSRCSSPCSPAARRSAPTTRSGATTASTPATATAQPRRNAMDRLPPFAVARLEASRSFRTDQGN